MGYQIIVTLSVHRQNQNIQVKASPLNTLKSALLTHFIGDPHRSISISLLTDILASSEANIQAAVKSLESQGFLFQKENWEALRIRRWPEHLHGDLLSAELAKRKTDIALHFHDSIDSTNNEAERLLNQGTDLPFVVVSSIQTEGRGRLKREWYSQDKGNLYFSFGFRPNMEPQQMEHFTLWMGLKLCQAINETCGVDLKVKWPNDLVHERKKVAGMLTESKIEGNAIRALIFGVGINVNSEIESWPEELRHTASSVTNLSGYPTELNNLAAVLIDQGNIAYQQYVNLEYKKYFDKEWKTLDALKDNVISASGPQGSLTGISMGINETGALRVRLENDDIVTFQAGDITLHKTYTG